MVAKWSLRSRSKGHACTLLNLKHLQHSSVVTHVTGALVHTSCHARPFGSSLRLRGSIIVSRKGLIYMVFKTQFYMHHVQYMYGDRYV